MALAGRANVPGRPTPSVRVRVRRICELDRNIPAHLLAVGEVTVPVARAPVALQDRHRPGVGDGQAVDVPQTVIVVPQPPVLDRDSGLHAGRYAVADAP